LKKGILPDYRKKQQLLYTEKRSANELIACGDDFLENGRLSDAVEFFQKANHQAGLASLKEKAMETGDTMLLVQVCRALNQPPTEEDWRLTGEHARELKKYRFAIEALQKSGQEELLQAVRELIKAEGNEASR